MKTFLDCIPCFIRQALDAGRMASDDPAVHEQMLRDVLRLTSEMRLSDSPPRMGQQIHRRLRDLTGNTDPYAAVKKQFNRMALKLLPELQARAAASKDPFTTAVRLAITGNIIDFGPTGTITEQDALDAVEKALVEPFYGDIHGFRAALEEADTILYLADNAGEIVFDRVLIEYLPLDRITLAVRGVPVINDATAEDAEVAGLTELVEVIDNGSDAPGTLLEDCSAVFRERFYSADLIIAKGQGNFETLSDVPAPIFFLFKAKCPVISGHAGVPLQAQVLVRGNNAT